MIVDVKHVEADVNLMLQHINAIVQHAEDNVLHIIQLIVVTVKLVREAANHIDVQNILIKEMQTATAVV